MKRVWLQTRASPARTSEGEGWGGGREELERSLFIQPVLPGLIPPLPSFSIPSLFFSPPSPLLPSFPIPSLSLPSPLPQPRVLPPPLHSSGTEGWSVHPHSKVRPVALSYVYGRCIEKMTVSPICWVVACGLRVLTGARVNNNVFY